MWTVQLALSVFKEEFITQWNYLMAATTLIMLPLLVMYVFMQKYFVEGIVTRSGSMIRVVAAIKIGRAHV